jgi:hypothetical protein
MRTIHVLIEFDATAPSTDGALPWWEHLKHDIGNTLASYPGIKNLELTHTSGDADRDLELQKAEHATEALNKILELLKPVDRARRQHIIKLLTHTS